MKKIIALILFVVLTLGVAVCAVSADTLSAKLSVEYKGINDNGNIEIYATFTDINGDSGIIICDYAITFDSSVLQLVDAEVKYPEGAENLSTDLGDSTYMWSIAIINIGQGVKNADDLSITLEFKSLNDSETEIKFTNNGVYGEEIENGITVDFPKFSVNSSSVTIQNKDNEASGTVSDVSPSIDTESEIVSNDQQSGSVSNNSSNDSSSNDSSGSAHGNTSLSLPDIVQNGDSSADDVDNASNSLWIIVAACVAIVIVIGVSLFFVNKKKGKRS